MGLEWRPVNPPAPPRWPRWRWWWRRWRARRYAWRADLAYRRWPSPANARTRDRADGYLRRVDASRP